MIFEIENNCFFGGVGLDFLTVIQSTAERCRPQMGIWRCTLHAG